MRPYVSRFRFRPKPWRVVLLLLIGAVAAGPAMAQDFTKYHSYAEMTSALQTMVNTHKSVARLESLGKTLGGRDIWAVEIANPSGIPLEDRPALLVVANFEADHLIGSEIALFVINHLLANYPADVDVKQRLDNHVITIIPRLNVDGAEGMFASLKTGRKTNTSPFDDDNDGRIDEDGPEDLNKDGFVTVLRVKAPDGEFMLDPEDERAMKRADPKQGETGAYKIFWEGIDNDNDGFINEDPPGGIDLNRNFQYEYPYYSSTAGPHMVSEKETRALMDWIIAHRNVAAILTFGESDNLITPPTSAGRLGSAREVDLARFAEASVAEARTVGMIQTMGGFGFGRRGMGFMMMGSRQRGAGTTTEETGRMRMPGRQAATTVDSADVAYFTTVSEKYIEMTGIRQPLYVRESKGAFFQYGYYQFGVLSLSTPGFGTTATASPRMKRTPSEAPAAGGQADRSTRPSARGGDAMAMMMAGGGQMAPQMMQAGARQARSGPAAGSASPGVDKDILRWMDSEKIDGFVDWTKFDHPELGEVEIGGFKPYAVTNPPAAKIAELGASHAAFVLYLSSLFPKVTIAETGVVSHGGGIFRITAEIENTGFLPTALAHGVTSRSVKPTIVQLGVAPEDIISGNGKTEFSQSLDGSGSRIKYEWLLRGKTGQVIELVVASEKGGSDKTRITLR